MASPIKIYHNLQTSVPVLSDSLSNSTAYLALLDACLVNGFNTKIISTLSVTNNVATATFATAHGYLAYDSILISGANQSQFNDSWMVKTVPDSTTLTFDITTADVTATGTITCKIAPLGWEIAYTNGTNLRTYRQPAGNRNYLIVNDDGTNSYRSNSFTI